VTFEYPQGRTATFSSIESNTFDHYYEMYMGTKGTLILRGETEAYLFEEGDAKATSIEVTAKSTGPVLDASESRIADAAGRRAAGTGGAGVDRLASYRMEVSGFCSAVRVNRPLNCGPERAFHSARACIAAHEAMETKARVVLSKA
jgi:hypothetical protein